MGQLAGGAALTLRTLAALTRARALLRARARIRPGGRAGRDPAAPRARGADMSAGRTRPTVTAIVTFWNRERYLEEAIESVLSQRHDVELLLVNDGSTDGSADIARRFVPPGRLVEQENRGAAGAANTGVRTRDRRLPRVLRLRRHLDDRQARRAARSACRRSHARPRVRPWRRVPQPRARPSDHPDPRAPRGDARRRYRPPRCSAGRCSIASARSTSRCTAVRGSTGTHALVRSSVRELTLPEIVLRRRIHENNNFATQHDAALGYLRALRPLVQKQRDP